MRPALAAEVAQAVDPESLAAIAVRIFGEDRVHLAPRLDDAIDLAVGRAEDDGGFGGSGVLVTGSVVTVGQARMLLKRER